VRHVPHAVLEAVRGLRHEQSGRTSLVVRLDPPELGAVVVRLAVRDGRVDVQLRTPDLGAREGLAAQHHDVEQLLREQGLDLRSFDVSRGELPAGQTGQEGSPDRGTPAGPRAADGPLRDQADVTDDAPAPAAPGTWL
jgi:flagellar hook-length control protein FliK